MKKGETVLVSWWFLHFNYFADTYFKKKNAKFLNLKSND